MIPEAHSKHLTNVGNKSIRLDVIAGLTAAAVVLPKAMAYATVAGLPVAVGLYTAFLPMVIYALLGSSRVLSVSSTTTIAILTAAQLGAVVPGGDPVLGSDVGVVGDVSGLDVPAGRRGHRLRVDRQRQDGHGATHCGGAGPAPVDGRHRPALRDDGAHVRALRPAVQGWGGVVGEDREGGPVAEEDEPAHRVRVDGRAR